MYIDQVKCIACKRCIPFCPVEAITEIQNLVTIDLEKCVECGVCLRYADCPQDAIYAIKLDLPRAYRKSFSDPFGKHENTTLGHMGRGTEEVKTNDVTGVIHSTDLITFAIELGRPALGAKFSDLQIVLSAIGPFAISFEINNPVTSLIKNRETFELDGTILNESFMSAIIEFSSRLKDARKVLNALSNAAGTIDTVFSLGIICRCNEDGSLPVRELLDSMNLDLCAASAKTNLGLGRPLYEDRMMEMEGGLQ